MVIDAEGVARAVFPQQMKKRRPARDIETARLVIDEHGVARAVFPSSDDKKLRVGLTLTITGGLHLRVGRHRESYARTKFVELPKSAELGKEGEDQLLARRWCR
jgi:hypothetical protein